MKETCDFVRCDSLGSHKPNGHATIMGSDVFS